jgi:hypothetical protein
MSTRIDNDGDVEFSDEDEGADAVIDYRRFSEAVVTGTDWTTETILSQLKRGNIVLNPRFQRRDAWNRKQKSRFIESIVLGLPIPQLVLAEKKDARGRFIVLDGKQRLLSLLQFAGGAPDSPHNAFRLQGLDIREDLNRYTYERLERDPTTSDVLTAFHNHTIRTVVIRSWPNIGFLHTVFLRLNTGSLKLSAQELRQAMFPGGFSDFADDAAVNSVALKALLDLKHPDYRMRDVELLVRHLAFRNFLSEYKGRMKDFLDDACDKLNSDWESLRPSLETQVGDLNAAATIAMEIFGAGSVARMPGSRSFNRAIFDVISFYFSDFRIRDAAAAAPPAVVEAYQRMFRDPSSFLNATVKDTAAPAHTALRFQLWGEALRNATGLDFNIPAFAEGKFSFSGFWRQ